MAAVALLTVECAHAPPRPCPQPRPFAARSPTRAPEDDATRAEIEAAGGHYEPCGRHYILSRAGRPMTDDERRALNLSLFGALHDVAVETSGIGGISCSPVGPREVGLVTTVRENSLAPAAIWHTLVDLAARAHADDAALAAEIEIVSAPGPRCGADDPACGPQPYWDACPERPDPHPRATRHVVQGGSGACARDGECIIGGCGNQCVSTNEIPRVGTCELRGNLGHALCGCVAGRCAWFRE